ncbi:hypothetical protein LG198_04275 [Methylobacillus arboreus]|uniref:hypothetical protein n=1 Tax=Methylobacillus arboreus TaxID=755170 RepID=UPI001E2AAEC9|nr:hypothetical protein [Methylobacillus arboreus]MCB5189943.1 hypothetical protein [Methylobacillus arboreus]
MMKRTLATLTMIGAFSAQAYAAEDVSKLNPQPGQWSTVIAIFDHLENHYLLKTSVHDDIESCSARLQNTAEQIKKANNVVFTAPRNTKVSFEKEEGVENEAKVLEIRCVLEPFRPERV